jgi:hypothetical protein
MYIFSIVGPWLLIGTLLSLKNQQDLLPFLKGTVSGLYWFIPWMILRILLPQIFTFGFSVSEIFSRYLIIHTLVPVTILLLTTLKSLKTNKTDYLFGKLVSFFIFSGYLNIFLFPLHGPYSAAFLIPISTILLLSGFYFGLYRFEFKDSFTFSKETRLRSKLLNNGFILLQLLLICVIISYVFVLDFLRRPGYLVSLSVIGYFLLFSIYVSPQIITLAEKFVFVPWIDRRFIPIITFAKSKLVGKYYKKSK